MLHGICRKTFAVEPLQTPPWRKLELDLAPLDVAAGLRSQGGLVFLDTGGGGENAQSFVTAAPVRTLTGHIDKDWEQVRQVLREHRGNAGGLFGFVGYDGHYSLGLHPQVMVFHHETRRWHECGTLSHLLPATAPPLPSPPVLDFQPRMTRAAFIIAVERAKAYIAAGDIYQVNLAHSWRALWPADADALALYARLREVSPAPYGAFLETDGAQILCASMESFLRMTGRDITTRPIKGTRPRFPENREKDAESARELITSPKERAELLMITDLLRNDLGMACEFGSIHTPDLARVESFAQVFHLVSTVRGTLREDMDHASALRACFPGGSITGAPKKRAREIIAELEPAPRGIYTGALGYFGFSGESEFNIVIRTAVRRGDEITLHAGAGIVADSVPALEHEETLHKAAGLLRAATGS